jgi:hypothetical protein
VWWLCVRRSFVVYSGMLSVLFCIFAIALLFVLCCCSFVVCLVVCCFMFSLEFRLSTTYFPNGFIGGCAGNAMSFSVCVVCRPGSISFVWFGGEFQWCGGSGWRC